MTDKRKPEDPIVEETEDLAFSSPLDLEHCPIGPTQQSPKKKSGLLEQPEPGAFMSRRRSSFSLMPLPDSVKPVDVSVNEAPPAPLRQFEVHHEKAKEEFVDNSIHTSKYTVADFVPKNLIEQFSKLANIYFLIMMILQVRLLTV